MNYITYDPYEQPFIHGIQHFTAPSGGYLPDNANQGLYPEGGRNLTLPRSADF